MKKILTVLLSVFTLLAFQLALIPGIAFAVNDPVFPACANPQGTLIASYNNGVHGIPGDTGTYNGSDKVYSVTGDTLIQCFCAVNGNGIQTNWWKVSSLSQDQIDVLKSEGWTFVPNGIAWGLEDSAYMIKNAGYSCGGTGNGGSNSNSSSDSNSSTGQVLGLAFTGNIIFVFAFLGFGISSLLLGLYLSRK